MGKRTAGGVAAEKWWPRHPPRAHEASGTEWQGRCRLGRINGPNNYAAGDVLLQQHEDKIAFITSRHLVTKPRLQVESSLWTTGSAVVQAAHAQAPATLVQALMNTLAPAMTAAVAAAKWVHGQLVVSVPEYTRPLVRRLVLAQQEEYGHTALHWLEHVDISVVGALWCLGTHQVRARD